MSPKKPQFLLLLLFMLFAIVTAVIMTKKLMHKPPQLPGGDLKVLTAAPSGEEMPISVDGFTVMFDRPMVPLTTLDKGRDQKIDLIIEPKVSGKFFWLGTHGFIFRPDAPFVPATVYNITLPAGIKALDGSVLKEAKKWTFTTVRPAVINWNSTQNLLPKKGLLFLEFNLAMDTAEVEKKLSVIDTATGEKISAGKKFKWLDGDHVAYVEFTNELPWETTLKVSLPEGIRGKVGELGMKAGKSGQAWEAEFITPPKHAEITRVYLSQHYDAPDAGNVEPEKEAAVYLGEPLCFEFTQAVTKDSFKKSISVASDDPKGKKPVPYIYADDYASFEVMDDRATRYIEGYREGCVSLADDYERQYTISIDPSKLETLSGVKITNGTEKYVLKTGKAEPTLWSNLTRSILSMKGPKKIPYGAINLKGATVKAYRLPKNLYSEDIKSVTTQIEGQWDNNVFTATEPKVSQSLGYETDLVLPLDSVGFAIDETRMPSFAKTQIDVSAPANMSGHFTVDVDELSPEIRNSPGFYLLEVIGEPSVEGMTQPRPVYSAVQVTPIALAIKREAEHALVWATDIESGKPVSSLPIRFTRMDYDRETKIDAEGNTNEEGVSLIPLKELTGESWGLNGCVEVTDPARGSYSCEANHQLPDNYKSVLPFGKNFFAYVYTDRPIYRPGQTVYFSSFVREVREGRYFLPAKDETFTLSVRDASGNLILEKKDLMPESGGVISGEVTLEADENMPRGNYEVAISAGTQYFSKVFVVASYRKPTFKVDIAPKAEEIVSKETLTAEVSAEHFFGAPLRKAQVRYSIMTSSYLFSPDGYEGYSFVDEDDLFKRPAEGETSGYDFYTESEFETVYEYPQYEAGDSHDDPRDGGGGPRRGGRRFYKDENGKPVFEKPLELDDEGKLNITYTPDLSKYPISQTLTVEASVSDASSQSVSASTGVVVHKADHYFGIMTDKWAYGEKDTAQIGLVSLTTDGMAAGGKKYSLDLIRRDYEYIERKNSRGSWELVFQHKDTLIKTLSGKTNGEGKDTVPFEIPGGGEYRIALKAADDKGNEIKSAMMIWAWGEGYVPWKINEPQKLEIVPDKDSYKVGETAHLLIKSLMPVTKALVTLERGHMLEYKIVEMGGEDANGNANHLDIPITEGFLPNIYVSILAHSGRGKEGSPTGSPTGPPLLFHGSTELTVEPESKRLNVEFTPDKSPIGDKPATYGPGEKVTVKVKTTDPTGKPQKAHVMVSVADESVLRLLAYKLPDLVKKFYYRRDNNVLTSSSMMSLKAGDGGKGDKRRRNFKDTAHFVANLTTDEKGEGEFTFTLPDDLTTWVIEGLAITESKTREAYEAAVTSSSAPKGQKALGYNLSLTDNTFVGGSRAKIMTSIPVNVRLALPRFAAYGDKITGRIIANNQNPTPIEGKIVVELSGNIKTDANPASGGNPTSGAEAAEKLKVEIPFSLKAQTEESYPFEISVGNLGGRVTVSASALDGKGDFIDGLENSFKTLDRYAPEVTATSGMTMGSAKEAVDIPKEITAAKGGMTLTVKASLGLAVVEPLRGLIFYPYGCSEQKSSSAIAMVIARTLTLDYGEKYFTALVPLTKEELKGATTLIDKVTLIDNKVKTYLDDMIDDYQHYPTGGIKYWPESREPSYYSSVQVLWSFAVARDAGYDLNSDGVKKLTGYIKSKILERSLDEQAYAMWVLSLWKEDQPDVLTRLLKEKTSLSVSGLSYLLLALENNPMTAAFQADKEDSADRLRGLALQEPRHTSWGRSSFFYSSAVKNTALATWALMKLNREDPLVPRAMAFLFNRKVSNVLPSTQDNLYLTAMALEYGRIYQENKTNHTVTVDYGEPGPGEPGSGEPNAKRLIEKKFTLENILDVVTTHVDMAKLKESSMPAPVLITKDGDGTAYYDMVLKYYLPPELTPTREEGLIISREYYAIDDVKEATPLTTFKVGENYRGHITLVVPQEMNYIILEDLLPAGFEPVDMTLATSSLAADIMSGESTEPDNRDGAQGYYADEVVVNDYGMDWNFVHQEIRDDSILWSDVYMPAGVYHIRYPVRATTPGTYLMSGAQAFEFYEPEIFGRSRSREITITK